MVGLFFLVVVFGGLVELRSAFQKNRKTDFGVYARTAWAVRTGEDIYAVADDNKWHYCYPPPFAVLMTPFADPPRGADRTGYLPFWASVAVWYVFSIGCLVFALDRFAAAVFPDEPRWSRRWWYARLVPLYVCIGGVGYTLSRGQVNLLVLAMLGGMFAATVANRRFTGGLWLGAAVCLKVIPAFLGLYLLIRRDMRGVAGAAVACVVGLLVIPATVWGPVGAVEQNLHLVGGVIAPGAGADGDQTRAKELTNDTATDSQSFRSAIHALVYPNRSSRPAVADRETGLAHWVISAGLTLATVVLALRRRTENGRPPAPHDQLILFGGLVTLMLLVTPVSHMHYYAYALPLVCGLWMKEMAERSLEAAVAGRTVKVLAVWGVATGLPLFPWDWAVFLRECGFGPAVTVALWAYGMASLGRGGEAAVAVEPYRPRMAA